jgi:hypothetical protein
MPGYQRRIRQVTPTEREQRAAQQLLDQWLVVGRKTGIRDKATIMTAVANLVAYLLCQYDNLSVAEEEIDAFADNVRDIVTSHYLKKYGYHG